MEGRTRRPLVGAVVALSCLAAAGCADHQRECAQNLHRIGQALHEYHDTQGAFPMAALSDKQGRPGLSWRVAILPYLGHKELYDRFHLDEAWDGPHNRELLGAMPAVFACPDRPKGDPSLTSYQAFTGKGAFFEPPYDARQKKVWWTDKDGTMHYQPAPTRGLSIAAFTDGTANTFMVVEAKEGVPWTKPGDLPFDPDRPASGLMGAGAAHRAGFNALFVDGSVQCIPIRTDAKTIRALITRSGDEVVRREKL